MKDEGQLIGVTVVSGDSGTGKSRWIRSRFRASLLPTPIVIHEGFQGRNWVRTVSALCERAERHGYKEIGLHLDVTEYGDLAELSKLLHFLLFCGVLWDEQSGECFALTDERKLHLCVELPALEDCDSGGKSVWPPAGANDWRTAQHPFLAELPVLSTVCAGVPGAFVEVRSDAPYELDPEARLVAKYLQLAGDGSTNLGLVNDITELSLLLDRSVGAEERNSHTIEEFFRAHNVAPSKAVRSKVLNLLHSRFDPQLHCYISLRR
jgi:hypothetical protein